MDKIYQEAVNGRIQYHSEEIGRIKECGGREPIWSEERPLFKRRRGKTRFEPLTSQYLTPFLYHFVLVIGSVGFLKPVQPSVVYLILPSDNVVEVISYL